jgi:peptidoglycan-N-acetylglucosamine deacetylase
LSVIAYSELVARLPIYESYQPTPTEWPPISGAPRSPLWGGTIGDSRPIKEPDLIAYAKNSFQPQQIVLAHTNLPTITHCYVQLIDIIQSRNLQTITLNDV